MSGGKSDLIWYFFEKLPSKTATGSRAKCKRCGHELMGLVQRIIVFLHLTDEEKVKNAFKSALKRV